MKNFKIPHVFIFLFWIIIICSLLSYVIPSGSFERTTKDYGSITQTVIVSNSYKEIPKNYSLKAALFGENVEGKSLPVSVLGILSAIPRGLGDSAILVFYVFIIGGCANYWMRIDRNECLFYWSFNNGSKNCRHVR